MQNNKYNSLYAKTNILFSAMILLEFFVSLNGFLQCPAPIPKIELDVKKDLGQQIVEIHKQKIGSLDFLTRGFVPDIFLSLKNELQSGEISNEVVLNVAQTRLKTDFFEMKRACEYGIIFFGAAFLFHGLFLFFKRFRVLTFFSLLVHFAWLYFVLKRTRGITTPYYFFIPTIIMLIYVNGLMLIQFIQRKFPFNSSRVKAFENVNLSFRQRLLLTYDYRAQLISGIINAIVGGVIISIFVVIEFPGGIVVGVVPLTYGVILLGLGFLNWVRSKA